MNQILNHAHEAGIEPQTKQNNGGKNMTNITRSLLTTEQAADYLNISKATLYTWRATKRNIIPYIKMGGRFVRYRKEDLDAYIEANLKTA